MHIFNIRQQASYSDVRICAKPIRVRYDDLLIFYLETGFDNEGGSLYHQQAVPRQLSVP